jgi:hypothetical protein
MRSYLKLFIILIIFLPIFLVISTGVLIDLEKMILLLPDWLTTLDPIKCFQSIIIRANKRVVFIRRTNNISIRSLFSLIYKFNEKYHIVIIDPYDEISSIISIAFFIFVIFKFFEFLLSSDSLTIVKWTEFFLIFIFAYIFIFFLVVYIFYGF